MGNLALKPGLLLALLFTVVCSCVYSVRCHDLPRSLSKVYRSKCHSYRTAVNELSQPRDGQDRLSNAGKHYKLSMLCWDKSTIKTVWKNKSRWVKWTKGNELHRSPTGVSVFLSTARLRIRSPHEVRATWSKYMMSNAWVQCTLHLTFILSYFRLHNVFLKSRTVHYGEIFWMNPI